jgi:hypothetical protein
MKITSIINSFRREFVGYIPKYPGNAEKGYYYNYYNYYYSYYYYYYYYN